MKKTRNQKVFCDTKVHKFSNFQNNFYYIRIRLITNLKKMRIKMNEVVVLESYEVERMFRSTSDDPDTRWIGQQSLKSKRRSFQTF
jgi:hypothetical protein